MTHQHRPPVHSPGEETEPPAWSAPADNPFTFQGEVAGLAAFAAGVSRSGGWKQRLGAVLALVSIIGLVVSLLAAVMANGSS